MAILLSNQTGSLDDTNNNVYIGLKTPLYNDISNGYFASTSTYLEAARDNLRNLLSTKKGERVMQPNLGLDIHARVFEPITDSLEEEIRQDISQAVRVWLPFLTIKNILVNVEEGFEKNTIGVKVDFTMGNVTELSSVQVTY